MELAWEDRPVCCCDVKTLMFPLTNSQAFVLSRVDGHSTIADLCTLSGFSESESLEIIKFLFDARLVTLPGMDPIGPPVVPDLLKGLSLSALPPFYGVDKSDAAFLQSVGAPYLLRGTPLLLVGAGPYGNFNFDKRALLEHCDLTLEQRREMIFLDASLDELDFFELIHAEPTDDVRALKKAYFQFSRRFHPDSFFRKNLGSFLNRVVRIFKRGTQMHDRLAADDQLRTTYVRAVMARNQTYRQLLEFERATAQQRRLQQQREDAQARKAAIQERYQALKAQRQPKKPENPKFERKEKAQAAHAEGLLHLQSGKLELAQACLQRAVLYEPDNEEYKADYARSVRQAKSVKAEVIWKDGRLKESVGQIRDAMTCYAQAVEIYPDPQYCAHFARLLLQYTDDLRVTADLAQKAVAGEPTNVDYGLLLAQIYERAGMIKKSISALERILTIDPQNEVAKKQLRLLKR